MEKDFRLKHYYGYHKQCLTIDEKRARYAYNGVVWRQSMVSRTIYGQILRLFFEKVWNEIIFNNYQFKLPERMGVIGLRKFKQRLITNDGKLRKSKLYKDWQGTFKMWKEYPETKGKKWLFHDNSHTNGFTFMIKWNDFSANFKNKKIYEFKVLNPIKRKLSQALQDPTVKVDAYDSTFKKYKPVK